MPAKKRKATEKPEGSSEDEAEEELVLSKEAAHLLREFEEQGKEREAELLDLIPIMQNHIRKEFKLQLVHLPRNLRDMPLKQFVEEYGGSMQAFLLKDVQERFAASVATATAVAATVTRTRARGTAASALTTQRKTRAGAGPGETPAAFAGGLGGFVPGTVVRAPTVNETIYSINGSPLGTLQRQPGQQAILKTTLKGGKVVETPFVASQAPPPASVFGTVVPRNRPGSKTGVPESLNITLRDGQQVTVPFDGGLEKVPAAQRGEAKQLFEAHMEDLNKFAAVFRGRRK